MAGEYNLRQQQQQPIAATWSLDYTIKWFNFLNQKPASTSFQRSTQANSLLTLYCSRLKFDRSQFNLRCPPRVTFYFELNCSANSWINCGIQFNTKFNERWMFSKRTYKLLQASHKSQHFTLNLFNLARDQKFPSQLIEIDSETSLLTLRTSASIFKARIWNCLLSKQQISLRVCTKMLPITRETS